ncbi:carbohydrate ABC transporter permease [Paenibacillus humicola]|uniref:carbohydrate ABC transporter permease n=1 Tax=Paenibacillus humicola TaxID=3110540 RepID=UPI00237B20F8|nr:carbohydrate ABC transporter permease [Paenibacillus humicola]
MVNTGINRPSVRAALYVVLILLSLLFFLPAFWTFTNSLQKINSLPTFLPTEFHFENYRLAVTLIDFWTYTRNSVIITGISVVLTLFSSAFVGYAFARLQAPGKKYLFLFVLSTMMLPGIVTQIPTYILFKQIGLTGTFIPWVLWGIGGSPFNIFLYRQFYASFPKELEEAARIDGCSTFRIFWNIFVPLSVPIIATIAIMAFNFHWGADYLTPFMFLTEDKYPLVTALASVGYTYPENPNVELVQVANAALILFIIPIVVIFFIGQRYLLEGVLSSAVKG